MKMFTARQIHDTLRTSNERSVILALQVKEDNDFIFDLCEHTPFYSNVYNYVSYALESFRKLPHGTNRKVHGLTVSQIGTVLDNIGEPWPDIVIATAIQYQLLKMENKFFPISEIMTMKFFNLDVRQHEQFFRF